MSKPKITRFAITLALLDDAGKIVLNKSGGSNNVREITSPANFKLLSKAFRVEVKQWFKDENALEKRKAAWTDADRKAAAERKAKLKELT